MTICLGLGLAQELRAQEHANLFDQVAEHKLKNGLKVLLLKESRAPIITIQVWYRVGSRNEELGKTGISHLCEHLMFKGTAKYPPKFFSREVQRVGGSDNAFTGRDYTAYFETGPKDQLKHWLEMEADRMKGINVDQKNFETEKKVVIEERRMRTEDDPGNFMLEAATAATFEAHPYQWPVIGWLHDIESISLEDYQNYYHRYYQPNNCTLVVVGDIEPQDALKVIEATFGDLPAGPEPPKVTAQEPKQFGERRVEVHREAQFPNILMSYHVPNWQDKDAYPLELLNRILSQGRSSRLYNELVYKQKLALEAGVDYNLDTTDPFVFMLYGQPMPGKTVAQLEAALEAEIRKMQAELVSDTELQKAKNQTAASFYMSLDSIFYRGMLLGRTATVANWTILKDFIPKIQQVTAEDVRRVAKKYLTSENRTVGILVPVKTGKPKVGSAHPSGAIR
ncbi:MAG: insulinase family protein [Deltaproteobacteria bacterium]|nr:insulinase family protein [Deltaproteobacteria bacterium]